MFGFGKKSAAKKRVPVCPICGSDRNMECRTEFLSGVTFACSNPECIEHYRSVGQFRDIQPAPENPNKAPKCPKCGHSKYVAQDYYNNDYVCNKHRDISL